MPKQRKRIKYALISPAGGAAERGAVVDIPPDTWSLQGWDAVRRIIYVHREASSGQTVVHRLLPSAAFALGYRWRPITNT